MARATRPTMTMTVVVDVEHQIAKFLAITLRVCSGLVVLTYCTLGQRLLLLSLES